MSYWSWCCLYVPCMYMCTHGTVFLLVSVQRVKWGINQWDTLILPLHYILSCSWLCTEAVEFVCCVWPEIGVNKSSLFVGGWVDGLMILWVDLKWVHALWCVTRVASATRLLYWVHCTLFHFWTGRNCVVLSITQHSTQMESPLHTADASNYCSILSPVVN